MKTKLLIISLLFCLNSFGQKLPITPLCWADVHTYFSVNCNSDAFAAANSSYFDATYAKAGGDWLSEFRNYGPPDATAPTVTTTAISAITSITATSGGNVTSDGGASVTARGVCWNTSSNPTTANNYTSNGTGTGSFSSSLTGLSGETTYYVRAYATNSAGTSYGSNVSFSTVCTLPGGLTNYDLHDIRGKSGEGSVNFTGSFADACTALSYFLFDGWYLTGTGNLALNLNVGSDMYINWGGDCTKTGDGYYIIEYSSMDSPIYHIEGGVIVSKDVCPQ